MSIRQKLIKLVYPWLAKVSRNRGVNIQFRTNENNIKPLVSFYSLSAVANNGRVIDFSEFKHKKVLVVNTASACGYTPQYDDLQKLQQQYADKLKIIGFPSNDFGAQEQGSDEEIANFCKINYGVTFTLAKKSHVKDTGKNEVFKWLSDKNKNGWNEQQPQWNFCKYLVDESGTLLGFYASGVQPFDNEIIDAL